MRIIKDNLNEYIVHCYDDAGESMRFPPCKEYATAHDYAERGVKHGYNHAVIYQAVRIITTREI